MPLSKIRDRERKRLVPDEELLTRNEKAAKQWLMKEYNLSSESIIKQNGTPDYTTPIGDFEVKTLTKGRILFGGGPCVSKRSICSQNTK